MALGFTTRKLTLIVGLAVWLSVVSGSDEIVEAEAELKGLCQYVSEDGLAWFDMSEGEDIVGSYGGSRTGAGNWLIVSHCGPQRYADKRCGKKMSSVVELDDADGPCIEWGTRTRGWALYDENKRHAGLKIKYTQGTMCLHRDARGRKISREVEVHYVCRASLKEAVIESITEESACKFIVTVLTRHSCPAGRPLPFYVVVLIYAALSIAAYMIVGVFVNIKFRGKGGIDIIPHVRGFLAFGKTLRWALCEDRVAAANAVIFSVLQIPEKVIELIASLGRKPVPPPSLPAKAVSNFAKNYDDSDEDADETSRLVHPA